MLLDAVHASNLESMHTSTGDVPKSVELKL